MRARTKTVFKNFDYMYCDDFAQYLSNMAAKGWHFKEWSVGLIFEKGEPEQAIYAVEVFPKASENDIRPEPDTEEFVQYCEAAGWKFLDAKRKFCIFKKIDQEAVDLFTPEERVDNALKGKLSVIEILLLILYGCNAALGWFDLASMFESNIFSSSFIYGMLFWTILFGEQLLEMVYVTCKSKKLKKKVHAGQKIYIGNRQDGKYRLNIKDVYMILWMVLFLYSFLSMGRVDLLIFNVISIIVVIVFSVIINKVRPEREKNVVIQAFFAVILVSSIYLFSMTVLFEESENSTSEKVLAPLMCSDYKDCGTVQETSSQNDFGHNGEDTEQLRECEDQIESISHSGDLNFLGSVDEYFIFAKDNTIYYKVYQSKYTWILDKLWKDELEVERLDEEKSDEEKKDGELVDCTTDWEAQKALRNEGYTYYVRYENAILVFADGEADELLAEQIHIIIDKLKLR